MSRPLARVGIVAIGRDEGDQLLSCLGSLPDAVARVAYVDSGSRDGSVARARAAGADVVELDPSRPFTAARARNAGLERLLEARPDIEYVQFIDADCSLCTGWLETAVEVVDRDPGVVAVWGSRREAHPDRSVYNRLCDLEWSMAPLGESRAFGGDVLVRVDGVRQVGGYDPAVIAAEDGELSVRLRKEGWRILRIDAAMTTHDAAMTRLSQWWRRNVRCGYAYGQVSGIHGGPPERYFAREKRRVLLWALALPLFGLLLLAPTRGLSLLLLAACYFARAWHTARARRKEGWKPRDAWVWGVFCILADIPQLVGLAKYHVDRFRSLQPTIIEYKHVR